MVSGGAAPAAASSGHAVHVLHGVPAACVLVVGVAAVLLLLLLLLAARALLLLQADLSDECLDHLHTLRLVCGCRHLAASID
jgi:hypothetical protein